jgi:hypothetical protein
MATRKGPLCCGSSAPLAGPVPVIAVAAVVGGGGEEEGAVQDVAIRVPRLGERLVVGSKVGSVKMWEESAVMTASALLPPIISDDADARQKRRNFRTSTTAFSEDQQTLWEVLVL